MRRKEKEILDKDVLREIIYSSRVCRLGLSDGIYPYIVPLCFGYQDNTLYFHSAQEGKKIELLKKNPNICFEFDQNSSVVRAEKPCSWGMKYQSIIGYGKAEFVETRKEKQQALNIIMRQYSSNQHEFPDSVIDKTTVFKIKIIGMTGKQAED
ncbi:MAG TPA: pyridoxamine 5'-phosphate oxidase family protein [Desulfocapsa sulfexigens]|nr:pyridoxamine 5'-phosphate oxidase family protein [Desulfocapsa sulfexigens]